MIYDEQKDIRDIRNALLRDSDYTQLSDAPLTNEKKDEWVEYRQTLRDIPQTYEKIEDIIWPQKPGKE